jgi:hypothetical protein
LTALTRFRDWVLGRCRPLPIAADRLALIGMALAAFKFANWTWLSARIPGRGAEIANDSLQFVSFLLFIVLVTLSCRATLPDWIRRARPGRAVVLAPLLVVVEIEAAPPRAREEAPEPHRLRPLPLNSRSSRLGLNPNELASHRQLSTRWSGPPDSHRRKVLEFIHEPVEHRVAAKLGSGSCGVANYPVDLLRRSKMESLSRLGEKQLY